MAEDPALGLAVPRELHEWKHGRVFSEAWSQTRSYIHTEWARIKEVGYVVAEDQEVSGGGDGREGDGRKVGGGSGTTKPPTPPPRAAQPTPSHKNPRPTKGKEKPKRIRYAFESYSDESGF